MRSVLSDLVIEPEAALALALRIARAMDKSESDEAAGALARIGTAIAKYWTCKRAPGYLFEALECHGGPGYIEESILPRLYREAPVNSIWEGSGNIMCLDVLRAMQREPTPVAAVLDELEAARGVNTALDAAIDGLKDDLAQPEDLVSQGRWLTERMAIALQGSLMVRHAPAALADAFCASRLGDRWTGSYGALPNGVEFDPIIDRGYA